jgi:hypothetical protein
MRCCMEEEEVLRPARETERPLFHEHEYVVLTRPYLGLPEGSVGAITQIYARHPARYLVYFAQSLPVGPFPENALARLRALGDRERV